MTPRIAPARAREMPPDILGASGTEPAAAHRAGDRRFVCGAGCQGVPAPEAFLVVCDRDRRAPAWCPALYPFAGGAGALLTGGGAAGFAFFGFFAFLGFVSPIVALPLRVGHPA
ncbi:MAG: hypothetical protein ACLQHS_00875 [Candidatus Limnocylindrales bacterium]